MADDSEIDLYDTANDNWKRESLDLYDDVESQSNSDTPKETKSNSQSNYSGRRVATYVGNLRWWTTDQDLLDALNKLDIKDILEIRFHENRQNGQSKGFCVVVFGSDKSAKEAMEKLPKSELHGLAPIVTFCNKQNLNYFEQAAGGGSSSGSPTNNNTSNNNNNNGSKIKTEAARNNGPSLPMMCNNNNNNNQMPIGSMGNNMRFPGPMAMPGGMAGMSQNLLFNLSQYGQNMMNRGPGMMMQPGGMAGQMNQSQMMAAQQRMMQPSMMMGQAGLPMAAGNVLGGGAGGGGSGPVTGPTPHLNPNFFNSAGAMMAANMGMGCGPTMNQQVPLPSSGSSSGHHPQMQPSSQFDSFGRSSGNSGSYGAGGGGPGGMALKLSDNEFDEILQRNKTVSSSAINRAVQDASAGDYASAIETLVTAISLIKQSKIAGDHRCKVLINSLQDTLTGIETKSYGARKTRARGTVASARSMSGSSSDGGRDGSGDYSRRVLRSRSRDRRRRSRDYNNSGRSGNQQSTTNSGDYFSSVRSNSSNRYRH